MELSQTRRAILEVLLQGGKGEKVAEHAKGMGLTELAKSVGLKAPTVHAHLAKMQEEGCVERFIPVGGSIPRYRIKPFFQATWIDPHRGLLLQWQATDLQWEWPLISRVPDPLARLALAKFLPAARKEGLLDDAPASKGAKSGGNRLPLVIVYGSCARGQARLDSDLDVLVVSPGQVVSKRKAWRDLVAGQNLTSPRPLDIRVENLQAFLGLPEPSREQILREGITVYSPYPSDQFVENRFLQWLAQRWPEDTA